VAELHEWCVRCGSGIYEEHGQSDETEGRCVCGTHARRFGRSPSTQRESLLRIEKCEGC